MRWFELPSRRFILISDTACYMKRFLPTIVRLDRTKWLARVTLIWLSAWMTWVVTRPSYNFAHWIPHNLLEFIGIPYSIILAAEENADIFLHFSGGLLLTVLIFMADMSGVRKSKLIPFLVVCSMCVAAEVTQHLIGRGTETSDLLLGICGSFMAYLALENKR